VVTAYEDILAAVKELSTRSTKVRRCKRCPGCMWNSAVAFAAAENNQTLYHCLNNYCGQFHVAANPDPDFFKDEAA
jgi:hypothetical protein